MSHPATGDRLREVPGTQIGPYKLVQLLGEGGFGSVFMADQDKPVRRRVALKIIKLGMDTRQFVARFEQERQALAILDHPNIAKVFDAGATETGRPFFVMELCTGEPIDAYCDRNRLSIHERLELFSQVCLAVQHAHTKGLIHRDIKPSNVLVSLQDNKPHAKVIDFGIAKATASRLTEQTVFTEHRQLIGTPEYMSPEQAEGSLDIDTRTDVYSLGVLLYELLTGTTPFTSHELRSAAYAEIQRIIREVEPPKPSTRLSHNTDSIASVAAQRHTEPKKLGTIIRGELDWIVMRALEKDRARRYETANGLAMDVRRYLTGEAVVAAPPSTGYRARKFIQRNRVQVAAGLLVTLTLLLGLAGTAWQAKRASDRAVAAKKAEGEANVARDAEKARADELTAVSDFQSAMLRQIDTTMAGADLIKDIRERFAAAMASSDVPQAERAAQAKALAGLLGRVNATDTAAALIDRTILAPSVKAIDQKFKDQPVVIAQLRQALADSYFSIGLYDASLPLQESALATRRRELGEEHKLTIESIDHMATLLKAQGKLAEAEPFFLEELSKSRRVWGEDNGKTISSLNNMGGLLQAQGKLAEAEPYWREALERSRRVLGEEDKVTLSSITNMGALLRNQGKLTEAEPYWREAMEKCRRVLGEEHPQTLIAIHNMGSLLLAEEKYAEAEPILRESLERRRRVLGGSHPSTLNSVNFMGTLLREQGKLAEAEPFCREALDKRRRVLGDDHADTLNSISNMGLLLLAQGKHQEAIDLVAPAEPVARKAFTRANAWRLATMLTALGRARAGLPFDPDRFALAEASLLEAYPIYAQAQDRGLMHRDTIGCAQGLLDLYVAWDKAAPDKGYDTKSAEWKAKLNAVSSTPDRK